MFEGLSTMFGNKPLKAPTPAAQGAPQSLGQIVQDMSNKTRQLTDPNAQFRKRQKANSTGGNSILTMGGIFGQQ